MNKDQKKLISYLIYIATVLKNQLPKKKLYVRPVIKTKNVIEKN